MSIHCVMYCIAACEVSTPLLEAFNPVNFNVILNLPVKDTPKIATTRMHTAWIVGIHHILIRLSDRRTSRYNRLS